MASQLRRRRAHVCLPKCCPACRPSPPAPYSPHTPPALKLSNAFLLLQKKVQALKEKEQERLQKMREREEKKK